MSGPFVYELIFRGNATSATAAAKEVMAATDALAAETQGAAAVTNQDTVATVQNTNAKRDAAQASREAAGAAEAEAAAREALRKSTVTPPVSPAPVPAPAPAPIPAPIPVPVPVATPRSPAAAQNGAAAAYSANLMAQWNDVAMMAMAGQNPMMLMMQQGTQVTQTFTGLRAAGLSVGSALRSSFMGMLNPMNLATMAVIGFGAAAVQWFMDSGEQAKTLDEALGDLEKSTSAVDRAMKEAKKGTSELSGDFGSEAKAARELNLALLGLAQMQAAQDVKKSITAISEALEGMQSWINFGVIDNRTLEKQFNLTAASAAEVGAAIQKYQFAETNEDRIAAAQGIAEALERAQYGSEGATDAAILFGQEVGKTALLAQILKGQTKQIDDLTKSIAGTDIGATYKTGAEKGKELLDIISDVRKALKDTRAPYDLADDLEMTQRIAEATAQYGSDSLEVKKLQIEADRQHFEAQLRDITQLTEAHKQQLRDLWESSKGLSSADPFGLVAAGRELYRSQAQTVGQLQLELGLVGQSEAVRRRVLALYQAEMDIRTAGIDRESDRAKQIMQEAETAADLRAQLERVSDAWDSVQQAGEDAIDGIFDALKEGDIGGAFENLASEIGSMFEELAIKNPLKNAIFGTGYATMGDVGGLQGIWDRYTGKAGPIDAKSLAATAAAQTVASMQVTAATVIIGGAGVGGLAGGIGAGGGLGGLQGSEDVQKQVWSFFSSKGLKPHQVAAIMGNVSGESSFNPTNVGDAGTSFGLFQHHGARADGLMSSLGGRQNLGNVQGQLDYVWKELNTTQSGALAALKAAPDVSSATNAWMRQFERPSDEAMQKSWSTRLGAAEQAMAKFGSTTTLATGQLGTMGTGFDKFGQALGSAMQGGGGGGFFGTIFSAILGGLGIPGFAGGGQHGGGLRVVGENGPELEYTGPSTIVPADLTRRILTGGAPAASTTQIDARPVINITNNSSVPVQGEVQETTDSRGQRRFELVMADAVASGLTAGGGRARRTMRDYYGVNPVGILR